MSVRYLVIGAAVLVLVGAAVAFLVHLKGEGPGTSENARAELDAVYARTRAAGLPLTLQELDTWRRTSTPKPADTMLEAFSSFVPASPDILSALPFEGDGELSQPGQPLSSAARQALEKYTLQNGRALLLLERGINEGACRYPVDFQAGYAAEFPHTANVRAAARLLDCSAVLHADSGRGSEAAHSLALILRLAETLEREPALISQLVGCACTSMGLGTIGWAVNRGTLRDADLSSLASVVSNRDQSKGMWYALIGERCMFGSVDPTLGSGIEDTWLQMRMASETPEAIKGVRSLGVEGLRSHVGSAEGCADILRGMRVFDAFIRAEEGPLDEADAAVNEANTLLTQAPESHVLSKTLLEQLVRCQEARKHYSALCRTAMVGLAVKRYAIKAGKAPSSLQELVPRYLSAIPKDPFDASPIKFRSASGKSVIYSIGRNRQDESGKEGSRGTEGDIVFVILN